MGERAELQDVDSEDRRLGGDGVWTEESNELIVGVLLETLDFCSEGRRCWKGSSATNEVSDDGGRTACVEEGFTESAGGVESNGKKLRLSENGVDEIVEGCV